MSYLTRSRLRAASERSGNSRSSGSGENASNLTLLQRLATPKRAKRRPRLAKFSRNQVSPSSDQENVPLPDSGVSEVLISGEIESPRLTASPQKGVWSGIASARKRPRGGKSNDRDLGDVEMSYLFASEKSVKRVRPLGDVTNVISDPLQKSITSPQSASSPIRAYANIDSAHDSIEPSISGVLGPCKQGCAPSEQESIAAEVPTQRVVVVARLEISKEEQEMNGAPEGDLFEVTVLTDDELLRIESDDEASVIVAALLDGTSLSASATWADKFEAITNIRRLLKSIGSKVIKSDTIATSMCAVVGEGLESLRSTNVRNALLCMRSLLACLKELDSTIPRDSVVPLLQSLIRRCHTGARFISEQALAVSREVAPNLPLGVVVVATESLFGHKNADVSKRAYVIVCEAMASASVQDLMPLESTLVVVLKDGLKSKSPEVRSLCKQRLRACAERHGQEAFSSLLDKIMTSIDAATVKREIATTATAVSSIASARGSTMASSAKCAPTSIKSRFQAFQKKTQDKDVVLTPESNDVIVYDCLRVN